MSRLLELVNIKNERRRSAKAEDIAAPLDPARQEMIFRYEYQNNARLFQQRGWYIDRQGAVYKYSYERLFDSHDLSEIKFQLHFRIRPTLIARLPSEVLKRKIALVEKTKSGAYQEKTVADDAGIGKISAFSKDAATGKYREINLLTHGDREGKNDSQEASELLEWLSKVVPEYTF